MITTSAAPTRNRGLRIALVASLVVHVVLAILLLLANDGLRRIVVPHDRPFVRKPVDEIVTISSALRIEKRARPAPATRPRPVVALRRPPAPKAVAHPPRPEVALPAYRHPPAARHELVKPVVRAPAAPPRTQRATSPPGRDVATLQRTPATHPVPPAHAAFSQARLAQIERDLAQTIVQARTRVDPVRMTSHKPPAAPKHYRVQMQGRFGTLRHGEGTYSPIKAWRANGLDYYYVSYEFVYADGTYESGSVPWPIHFSPGADPFASDDTRLLGHTPLPAPPAGYLPLGTLGKALRSYFPNLRFADSG